jgi:tRNA(Arg) A34 adenosine deaminase TadA
MIENADEQGLAARLLEVIEQDIVPLTRAGVRRGNKLFGAAILKKRDLGLVVAATNRETENPLWHGEISTLNDYYALPAGVRPPAADCIFLSTHEPCSLCLSAITWAGFDNFFYLFGYDDTRDAFNIPHDLRILEEVFDVRNGAYRRENHFWTSHGIGEIIGAAPENAQPDLRDRVADLESVYADLSAIYQQSKAETDIPLN